mmetsp:Transcript_46441/g.98477  ORF Transcript_46441/g.98477 Transcript_46441/m.98477 type:complete len:207 (+) Transcript_46441:323-943(+)
MAEGTAHFRDGGRVASTKGSSAANAAAPIAVGSTFVARCPPPFTTLAMSSHISAVGAGNSGPGISYADEYRVHAATTMTQDAAVPASCATNCALGEAPRRWPHWRSCIMSPAPIAPASATAPATRFATTFPGETSAKRSWDTFPIPETGLRSVSPRARTARTATRREKRMAIDGSRGGMSNMGERTAVQSVDATRRPGSHVRHVIC